MAITVTTGTIFGVKIGMEFGFCDGGLSDYMDEEGNVEFDENEFDPEEMEDDADEKSKFKYLMTRKLAQDTGLDFATDGSSSSSNYIDGIYVGINVETKFRSKDLENVEKRFNELYTPEFQASLREIFGPDAEIYEPGIHSYYDAWE